MTITAVRSGSDSLLLQVRGALILRGTSLNAWCKSHGVDHAHAHRVLRGITDGERARSLRAQIVADSLGG